MNADKLTRASDGAIVAWQCQKCTTTYPVNAFAERAERKASECCGPPTCETCGGPIEKDRWGGWCGACVARQHQKREDELYAKATKVELAKYKEKILYMEGARNEGFVDVEDVEEELKAKPAQERLSWAWGCYPEKATLDLETTIRDSVLEEFHEGAADFVDWTRVEEAQSLIDAALKDVTTYQIDHHTVVVLTALDEEDTDDSKSG